MKSMFEQFRTVEKQDLGTSQSLENHALLVMNALDEAIANMDDPEYLIEMLLTTGKSHRRFDDFVPDSFWVGALMRSFESYVAYYEGNFVILLPGTGNRM